MMWEPPSIVIEGTTYKVQRLGLPQISIIARIWAVAGEQMQRAPLVAGKNADATVIGTFIVDAMAHALDHVIELLASVIGLDPGVPEEKRQESMRQQREAGKVEIRDPNKGTIRDPDVFPLGSEMKVIQALVEHQDVVAFFESFRAMRESAGVKTLLERLKKPSTESKHATGGRTKKS
jgi:hypothetical protein